jgi:hypothetical protein
MNFKLGTKIYLSLSLPRRKGDIQTTNWNKKKHTKINAKRKAKLKKNLNFFSQIKMKSISWSSISLSFNVNQIHACM